MTVTRQPVDKSSEGCSYDPEFRAKVVAMTR